MRARGGAQLGVTELHVVGSMHERKALMADLSDGFVAMPGGYGTFEEFCEVITWSQLGIHPKPCGLLNVAGYYAPLLAMFDHAVAEGFVRPQHRALVLEDTAPARLLEAMRAFSPPDTEEVDRPRRALMQAWTLPRDGLTLDWSDIHTTPAPSPMRPRPDLRRRPRRARSPGRRRAAHAGGPARWGSRDGRPACCCCRRAADAGRGGVRDPRLRMDGAAGAAGAASAASSWPCRRGRWTRRSPWPRCSPA